MEDEFSHQKKKKMPLRYRFKNFKNHFKLGGVQRTRYLQAIGHNVSANLLYLAINVTNKSSDWIYCGEFSNMTIYKMMTLLSVMNHQHVTNKMVTSNL